MNEKTDKLRRQLAPVFLLAVMLVLPAVLLFAGPEAPAPAAADGDAAPDASTLLALEGRSWPVEIDTEAGTYLMGAFLDALAGREEPGEQQAPPVCTRPVEAPVFVTVYPGPQPIRVRARAGTLAASVREAAASISRIARGRLDPSRARVRIDVLRDLQPLPPRYRVQFAHRRLGEPVGLAVGGSEPVFFLPGDVATLPVQAHAGMLKSVCRQAGLGEAKWRDGEVGLWTVRTTSFVNEGPGSRYALPCVRGLPPVGKLTLPRLLRASRLAAAYLVNAQNDEGGFLVYRDPSVKLKGGCEGPADQAAAAGALAAAAELQTEPEYVEGCFAALSRLMERVTTTGEEGPPMAYAAREDACRVVWELEATAHHLEAVCRFRRVSARREADSWIAAMARFLLFMQREDGLFAHQYDEETGARGTPAEDPGPAPQAQAARALALAHRELGEPRYLLAARQAVEALRRQIEEAGTPLSALESRWLLAALQQVHAAAPREEYAQWAGRIAAARRKKQLTPAEAPAPDLVGGTLSQFPPRSGQTADDLVTFALACKMDAPGRPANLEAAHRAAGFLARLQLLGANAYYLSRPESAIGGFRELPGSNVIRLNTQEGALRGLVALTRLELPEAEER